MSKPFFLEKNKNNTINLSLDQLAQRADKILVSTKYIKVLPPSLSFAYSLTDIFEFLFNGTSALVRHFMLSPGEREKGNRNASLRKHAYSNILKILPSKNENFQIKNSSIFSYFRRGGSNEYPQSMF